MAKGILGNLGVRSGGNTRSPHGVVLRDVSPRTLPEVGRKGPCAIRFSPCNAEQKYIEHRSANHSNRQGKGKKHRDDGAEQKRNKLDSPITPVPRPGFSVEPFHCFTHQLTKFSVSGSINLGIAFTYSNLSGTVLRVPAIQLRAWLT